MRQQYLILLCVMILTAICFFYFSSTSVDAKIRKIKAYDKRIKVEQEKLNSAKVLNQQLQEVSKVIMKSMTEDDIFSSEEVNAFVKQLATLADQYKIAVNSISPKVISSENKHFLEQQYTLVLNCTFVQMGQFLSKLESFDHIIKVKTLDVSPLKAEKKEGPSEIEQVTRYKVTIELSTFKIVKES